MTRAYGFLVRLYPRSHRAIFEQEMRTVFEEAAREHRGRGWLHFILFMASELAGALTGCCAQWVREMRRDEQGQRAALAEAEKSRLPPEIVQAQQRLQNHLRRMEYAIAHHQFTHARFYSEAEKREREQLRQLKNKYGVEE